MKPGPFVYHDPSDLEVAMRLLSELPGEVRLAAGCQSLMPMMNLRVTQVDHLIDLRRIMELKRLEVSSSHLIVGAMTTHRELELSPVVQRLLPLLSEAASNIGHIPIRTRGTIGGSLSLADPTAELPLVSVVLDALITLQSVRGQRVVPAAAFFQSALQTERADDEILTSVEFPLLAKGAGTAFSELSRRSGDFCIVGVAVVVGVKHGQCEYVRVGLGGVADRPVRSTVAELLIGEPFTEQRTVWIAEEIAKELDPISDLRGSAEDRRDIAKALIQRTLMRAGQRATAAMPARKGGLQ